MKKEYIERVVIPLIIALVVIGLIYLSFNPHILTGTQITKTFVWKELNVESTFTQPASQSGGCASWGASVTGYEDDGTIRAATSTSAGSCGGQSASFSLKFKLPDLENVKSIYVDVSGNGQHSYRANAGSSISFEDHSLFRYSKSGEVANSYSIGSVFVKIDEDGFITTNSEASGRLSDIDAKNSYLVFNGGTSVSENRQNANIQMNIADIEITYHKDPLPPDEDGFDIKWVGYSIAGVFIAFAGVLGWKKLKKK